MAGFWGGKQRNTKLMASSFHAVYAVAGLVLAAAALLWYGLLSDHFELTYVWNHSERALPTFYKFSALWGGQAGSLLFWALLLSGYSAIVAVCQSQPATGDDALCQRRAARHVALLPDAAGLCRQSL